MEEPDDRYAEAEIIWDEDAEGTIDSVGGRRFAPARPAPSDLRASAGAAKIHDTLEEGSASPRDGRGRSGCTDEGRANRSAAPRTPRIQARGRGGGRASRTATSPAGQTIGVSFAAR